MRDESNSLDFLVPANISPCKRANLWAKTDKILTHSLYFVALTRHKWLVFMSGTGKCKSPSIPQPFDTLENNWAYLENSVHYYFLLQVHEILHRIWAPNLFKVMSHRTEALLWPFPKTTTLNHVKVEDSYFSTLFCIEKQTIVDETKPINR